MNSRISESDPERLGTLPAYLQWLMLLGFSAALVALFELIRLPAEFLIGPMVAAIALGVNGATVRVPAPVFGSAQAVIGLLIAASLSISTFVSIGQNWLVVTAVVALTLTASSLLGWLISRWKIMPGSTAVWGSAPGAASAMVLMAGAFGADQRLVAFMQYLRVLMVTVAAAATARLWVDTSGVSLPDIDWFPAINWSAFASAALLGVAGMTLGRLLRLPSPFFLGTVILASVAHVGFGLPLQLPPWLLASSYAIVGWSIGLNFTPAILRHALRTLPQIALSILILMAFCGMLAWLLVEQMGLDPLTAYLATSPGGMDSIAIIAAASRNVDLSFVMAIQAARFLVVLLLGPALARTVARTIR